MAKPQLRETATEISPTRTLAEFIAEFSYKDIPPEVLSHIKFCFIDSLGCALFGSTLPWGKIITSFTKELGKGTFIHSFEMDDLHRVGVIHPGSEAIPAADALVRYLSNVDGKRLLTAV